MEEGVEEGRTAPTCSNRTDVLQPHRRAPAAAAAAGVVRED